jgi:hypothetical protein
MSGEKTQRVFIHAAWSGASVVARKKVESEIGTADLNSITFIDIDSSDPILTVIGKAGFRTEGWGEVAHIEKGKVVYFARLAPKGILSEIEIRTFLG